MRRTTLWCLTVTALLGTGFLMVKGFEYHDDIVKGLFPGPGFPLHPPQTQIFWAIYWISTGVHAVHLTVGIALVGVTTTLLYRERLSLKATRFEGIALYWHLVDIIQPRPRCRHWSNSRHRPRTGPKCPSRGPKWT